MKCVEKKQLSGAAVDNIITEITLLKLLKHEYIVEMKDFQWDERFVFYAGLYKILPNWTGKSIHQGYGQLKSNETSHQKYCELNIVSLGECFVLMILSHTL